MHVYADVDTSPPLFLDRSSGVVCGCVTAPQCKHIYTALHEAHSSLPVRCTLAPVHRTETGICALYITKCEG